MSRSKPFEPFSLSALSVEDIVLDGRGICKADGKVIFVEDVLPGDIVDIEVTRKSRKVFEGQVTNWIQKSSHRTEPVCQHFAACGGCTWQHFDYQGQLAFKEKQVRDQLERIGGIIPAESRSILGAPSQYFYRNKLEFSFSNRRWYPWGNTTLVKGEVDERVLGFHIPRFFDKILEIEHCHLQLEVINPIRNAVQEYARKHDYSFYDYQTQTGFLRNLAFRTSLATGELLVLLIVGEGDQEKITALFRMLSASFPAITSICYIVNTKRNDSYSELPVTVWSGPGHITEKLGGYSFQISPTSFFQTNPAQAERLYQVVKDLVGGPQNTIYDLYCGAGSIGIYVSALASKIVGVEYVQAAVNDAETNCKLNGLTHLAFEAGDLAKVLNPDFVAKHGRPETVITDPPRGGMVPEVVRQLIQLNAERIIYVSCNPSTQARDLQMLADTYAVQISQPVDMFPQTSHVENVVLLQRR